jgi:hypothetical protein
MNKISLFICAGMAGGATSLFLLTGGYLLLASGFQSSSSLKIEQVYCLISFLISVPVFMLSAWGVTVLKSENYKPRASRWLLGFSFVSGFLLAPVIFSLFMRQMAN